MGLRVHGLVGEICLKYGFSNGVSAVVGVTGRGGFSMCGFERRSRACKLCTRGLCSRGGRWGFLTWGVVVRAFIGRWPVPVVCLFGGAPVRAQFSRDSGGVTSRLGGVASGRLLGYSLRGVTSEVRRRCDVVYSARFAARSIRPVDCLVPVSQRTLQPRLQVNTVRRFCSFITISCGFGVRNSCAFFFGAPASARCTPVGKDTGTGKLALAVVARCAHVPLDSR